MVTQCSGPVAFAVCFEKCVQLLELGPREITRRAKVLRREVGGGIASGGVIEVYLVVRLSFRRLWFECRHCADGKGRK